MDSMVILGGAVDEVIFTVNGDAALTVEEALLGELDSAKRGLVV